MLQCSISRSRSIKVLTIRCWQHQFNQVQSNQLVNDGLSVSPGYVHKCQKAAPCGYADRLCFPMDQQDACSYFQALMNLRLIFDDSYALALVSLSLLGDIARRQRKSTRHNA